MYLDILEGLKKILSNDVFIFLIDVSINLFQIERGLRFKEHNNFQELEEKYL